MTDPIRHRTLIEKLEELTVTQAILIIMWVIGFIGIAFVVSLTKS